MDWEKDFPRTTNDNGVNVLAGVSKLRVSVCGTSLSAGTGAATTGIGKAVFIAIFVSSLNFLLFYNAPVPLCLVKFNGPFSLRVASAFVIISIIVF